MESNHHSARRRRYRPQSSPMLSVREKWGDRPDLNRRRGDHGPECFQLHHGHSGDDRDRTGGLSPDKRALYAAELRPLRKKLRGRESNPRLELMRLARKATPPPRSLAGRSRTCGLRLPGPAGWPTPLQPEGFAARHESATFNRSAPSRYGTSARTTPATR